MEPLTPSSLFTVWDAGGLTLSYAAIIMWPHQRLHGINSSWTGTVSSKIIISGVSWWYRKAAYHGHPTCNMSFQYPVICLFEKHSFYIFITVSKKKKYGAGCQVVVDRHTPAIPALWKQRPEDLEFKAKLVYIKNSRTARATQKNPILKQSKTTKSCVLGWGC